MALAPGTRLGPYELTAAIGSGGMGEVYKALDTRLGRTVAVKVSASEFSERFEREARSVAALNHPNICQLYDVGPNYLVMEHIEGRPVGQVQSPRRLLDLAAQMADGMAAAHAAGLIHRDLKPDNILVTTDGRAKILDFGLAKAVLVASDSDGLTRSAITDPGTTLGTVAYMSPEQARGDPNLGPQSDQFSFGLVLYEMVTGHRPFRRESAAETMTAIIREEAPPLPSSTPAPLRWVIERLLSKDPADRYESSRDLYRELRLVRDRLSQVTTAVDSISGRGAQPAAPRSRWITNVLIACLGLLVGAAVMRLWPPAPGPALPDLSRYRFSPMSVETATEREPAWSPDGRRIAYVASVGGVLQVMTRAIGGAQAAQLTRGGASAQRPFWSPDGSTIYFLSRGDAGGRRGLWAVNANGGRAERVIDAVTSAAVHPDGKTFAFVRDGRLWVTDDARGGSATAREFGARLGDVPTQVEEFSPDGTQLVVLADDSLWMLSFPGDEARRFALPARAASWMPDSRRLVVLQWMDGSNMALSMLDTSSGDTRLFYTSGYSLLHPAVSPDGRRIAFMGGDVTWDIVEVKVPSGEVQTMPSAGGVSWWPAWAPNGAHYAFVSDKLQRPAVLDVSSGTEGGFSRVLAEMQTDGRALGPVRWAPDGHRFSFTIGHPSPSAVLMLAHTSGSVPQRVDDRADMSRHGVWSPDGEWIAYQRRVGDEAQLVKLRPGSRDEPEVLRRWPAADAVNAARMPLDWSSDGRWLLAASERPGFFLISPDGAVERQLSNRGETSRPAAGFSGDARSVLYLEQNTSGQGSPWRLWSFDIVSGAERVLANVPLPPTAGDAAGFSLHPDGTRFLTSVANWPFDIWMLEGFDAE
jgi:Tol biopolymer transport system component/predicted Ser/Thr protein kinase